MAVCVKGQTSGPEQDLRCKGGAYQGPLLLEIFWINLLWILDLDVFLQRPGEHLQHADRRLQQGFFRRHALAHKLNSRDSRNSFVSGSYLGAPLSWIALT